MTEREQNRAAAEAFAKGDIEFDYGSASDPELPPPPTSEVTVTKSVKWPPELYRQMTHGGGRASVRKAAASTARGSKGTMPRPASSRVSAPDAGVA